MLVRETNVMRTILAVLLLVIAMPSCVARATTNDALAAKFFPDVLKTTASGPVPLGDRKTAVVAGDLNHDGTTLVVAVYCNGHQGAVSVLSPAGDGAVVSSIAPPGMVGRWPEAALVDFDHDGHPEIVATMQDARGYGVAWVYKWNGSALTLTGPIADASKDDYSSDLVNPEFITIDASGAIAAIDQHAGRTCCDANGEENVYEELRLFRWHAGQLTQDGTVDCFVQFTRSTGQPVQKTSKCRVTADGTRHIIVVNGNIDGSGRVSSAEVIANGQQVVLPSALNHSVAMIGADANFTSGDNTIAATLAGKPGGVISIVVQPLPH